ncbi:MAG TPA: methionyl-tRNA formyltransferase [Pirellulaceae bacterium]|nr:methionyl-tRNA formyltransferase [Pirellulaceae bacterium]
MRLLMLGTGPFAVPTFAALLDAGHDVPALITRPTPSAKGREKGPLNPMRDLAESRGIPVLAPESINTPEARQLLTDLKPELLVVCDYGQILSSESLAVAPLGGINLHGSLLPKYRGAAPVHWAILNGDAETGVTVIHMTPRLDGGPILAVRRTPIGPDETMPDLECRLSKLGALAVLEAIAKLQAWDRSSPLGMPQDPKLATKAPRLTKQDGAVDWTRSAEQIRNQVRALTPWPGTYTNWHRSTGEPLRLILMQVRSAECGMRSEPGKVLVSDGKQLVVAAGEGALSIEKLQPAGKRGMDASDFLRGYAVKVGDTFGPA